MLEDVDDVVTVAGAGSAAPVRAGAATAAEVEALVKHYRSRTGVVEAVRGVDLTVAAGEVFGFLGPNGAASRRRCGC